MIGSAHRLRIQQEDHSLFTAGRRQFHAVKGEDRWPDAPQIKIFLRHPLTVS